MQEKNNNSGVMLLHIMILAFAFALCMGMIALKLSKWTEHTKADVTKNNKLHEVDVNYIIH